MEKQLPLSDETQESGARPRDRGQYDLALELLSRRELGIAYDAVDVALEDDQHVLNASGSKDPRFRVTSLSRETATANR